MLARSVDDFPGEAIALVYEPKFDGFRALVMVGDDGRVEVYSRSLTRLTGSFPETAAAVGALVPRGTVLDGELVRWSAVTGALDFAALQRRLRTGPRRITELARTEPVTLVAFDCLEAPGHGDLRPRPLRERRRVLEELLRDAPAAGLVLLCPQETSQARARLWLELLASQGVEGVVIKPAAGSYRPGVRGWYKLKHRDETLAVVGGFTGALPDVTGLILGRVPSAGGRLRVAGRTGPPSARLRTELAAELAARMPAGDDHPWPAVLPAAWSGGFAPGGEPLRYVRVEPTLVVEVSVDTARFGDRWRHLARLEDVRPDLDPAHVPEDLDLDVDH